MRSQIALATIAIVAFSSKRTEKMNRRTSIALSGGCALAVLILAVLAVRDQTSPLPTPASSWAGSEAQDNSPGYDDPDQFFAYHAAIRGAGDGPGYPPNYRMEAFNKAVAARKKPARKLAWIERGPANAPGRTRAVIVDPDDPSHRTWYAGSVSGGLWKTVDAGASWEVLTDHLPNLAVSALAMASSDPDVIYMGTGESFGRSELGGTSVGGSGIFRSTDRGRTWTQLEATARDPAFRFVNRMVVDPDDAQTVVAATTEGIFRTIRRRRYLESRIHIQSRRRHRYSVDDLRARPDDFNIQFATVNSFAILRSTDAGRTWQVSLDKFIRQTQRMELAFAPSSPDVIYFSAWGSNSVGSDQLYRSGDGGLTWNPIEIDGPTSWLEVSRLGTTRRLRSIRMM